MEYARDRVRYEELGMSLGILTGIAILQGTGSVFALLALTIIGTGLGLLVGRIRLAHPNWAEEE